MPGAGFGRRGWERLTIKGHKGISGVTEVLYILIVVITWVYTFVKTHLTACFKFKLFLNKVDFLKKLPLAPTYPASYCFARLLKELSILTVCGSAPDSLTSTPVRLSFPWRMELLSSGLK